MKRMIISSMVVLMFTVAANAAPIARLSMDSVVASAVPDITGNGHDGTSNRTIVLAADDPFSLADSSSIQYTVANTSGVMSNPGTMDLYAGTNYDMSMEVWIKPSSFTAADAEVIKLQSSRPDYLTLGITPSGNPYSYVSINGVVTPKLVSGTAVPLNQWTHLALTIGWDGSNFRAKLYVDGVLEVNTIRATPVYGMPTSLTGAYFSGWGTGNFLGLIDDIGVYDATLSQAELGYNQTYTVPLTMPVPANTAIFKQSYNGYNGCRDKWLHSSFPDNSFGDYTVLRFGGVPWNSSATPGLIGFDNIFGLGQGQIPSDAVVTSAKLRVYVESLYYGDPNATSYVKLWPMRTSWVEGNNGIQQGSSCFNARNYRANASDYAADPNYTWGYTGSIETGPVVSYTDSSPVDPCDYAVGLAEIFTIEIIDNLPTGWLEFNVASFVNAWQDGSIVNNGIYGYSNGSSYYVSWYSSEYMNDPNKRPELVVTYEPLACGHPGVPFPLGDISGPNSVADCYVNIYDVAEMASSWIDCTNPGQPGCVELVPTAVIPPGTATVDADLTEWSGAVWIPLDKLYDGTPSDINDARFTVRWDAATDKIYAAVIVDDGDHVISDFPFAWDSHDHVEVYSQADPNTGSSYDPSYVIAQQYLVGKGTTAGFTWSLWGDGSAIAGDANFEYAATVNGSQIIYEVGVKQFVTYGGKSAFPTVVHQLAAGDVIGFDIVAFSRYTGGFEMKSENTMVSKYNTASAFRQYTLLAGDCGRWGYSNSDTNEDCKVDFADFADMADNWMYCTDPSNLIGCDQSWR